MAEYKENTIGPSFSAMEENKIMLKVSKNNHPEDTIFKIGDQTIGDNKFTVIAGPCSIESKEQMAAVGKYVKKAGAHILRGGAFKPRVSPYNFQGLGDEGVLLLKETGKKLNMPVISEILSEDKIDFFTQNVDIIQVGSRNMHNYALLKALADCGKPILLKRGFGATIDELLFSAEYLLNGGANDIILCERGIRTFENSTRNTLDISAVPVLKRLSHLPVFVDPSHAGGMDWLVPPLSKAALAAGADGIMIEVHHDPGNAKCDGPQSITPEDFQNLMDELRPIAAVFGKEI